MTNSATGRPTRSTASSCSPATASHVGEAIRHDRSWAGSNWSGCASTHRERSSACPAGRPRRVASARRCAPTSPNTAGSERSTGSVACARRSFSSSWLAGAVMRVQSRPASVSARACPSIERLDRRERQVAGVERDPVAAQHRLRVLIGRAPRIPVVGIDGLVLGQQHQRPPAEMLERLPPSAGSSAAAGAPRRCSAPARSAGRARHARCRDARSSPAGSTLVPSWWRRPPARRRRPERDPS